MPMKTEVSYVPVKRILAIINSCETNEQVKNCHKIVNDYVKSVSKQGVTNSLILKERLNDELNQRAEALYLASKIL